MPPETRTADPAARSRRPSFTRRCLAALADAVVQYPVMCAIILLAPVSPSPDGLIVFVAWVFALGAVNVPLMARRGARHGMTWAKQLVGVRVVSRDGRPISLGRAFVREVLAKGLIALTIAVVSVPVAVFYVALDGLLAASQVTDGRALHDLVAGTRLVLIDPRAENADAVEPAGADSQP